MKNNKGKICIWGKFGAKVSKSSIVGPLKILKIEVFFRRERGHCRICYSAMADTDFQVSGMTNTAKGYNNVRYYRPYLSYEL